MFFESPRGEPKDPARASAPDAQITAYDSSYKMKPPLRSERDVAAVIDGIVSGAVDVIATDHAPHPGSEKMQEFEKCPFGIIGLETALGLKDGNLARARFAGHERTLAKRYRHFRRFAVGFYDPAFRDLFFTRTSRFGIYEAVLSVLAGNWRPTFGTRLRLALFFGLVALQRVLPIAARSHSTAAWSGRAVPAPKPEPERTLEAER